MGQASASARKQLVALRTSAMIVSLLFALLLGLAGMAYSFEISQVQQQVYDAYTREAAALQRASGQAAAWQRAATGVAALLPVPPAYYCSRDALHNNLKQFSAYTEHIAKFNGDVSAVRVLTIVPSVERAVFEECVANAYGNDTGDATALADSARFMLGIRDTVHSTSGTGLVTVAHPHAEASDSDHSTITGRPSFLAADLLAWPLREGRVVLNAMNRSEDASVIHRALNSGTVASTGLTLPPDSGAVSLAGVGVTVIAPILWRDSANGETAVVSALAAVTFSWLKMLEGAAAGAPGCGLDVLLTAPPSGAAASIRLQDMLPPRSSGAVGPPPSGAGRRRASLLSGGRRQSGGSGTAAGAAARGLQEKPPSGVSAGASAEQVSVGGSADGTSFTFALEGGAAREVGWGDLRPPPNAAQQRQSREITVSVADVNFTLSITPRAECLSLDLYTAQTFLVVCLVLLACGAAAAAYCAAVVRGFLSAAAAERLAVAGAWAKAELALKEAKDQFTVCVSHEIRTPINAIAASAALLADTPLNEEQRELVQCLESGASQVVMVVDDVLHLNSLERGNFRVRTAKVNLVREVVEPAWRMAEMQPRVRERLPHLTLARSVAADVPVVLETDAARLRMILAQLICNAVKFTPDGGSVTLVVDTVTVRPQAPIRRGSTEGRLHRASGSSAGERRVPPRSSVVVAEEGVGSGKPGWLGSRRTANGRGSLESSMVGNHGGLGVADSTSSLRVRFRVIDTGIGIAPEKAGLIWEPYTQADLSSTRGHGGTGLGLAICLRNASALWGTLHCVSEGVNKGAEFILEVPVTPPPPPPLPQPHTTSGGDAPAADTRHALAAGGIGSRFRIRTVVGRTRGGSLDGLFTSLHPAVTAAAGSGQSAAAASELHVSSSSLTSPYFGDDSATIFRSSPESFALAPAGAMVVGGGGIRSGGGGGGGGRGSPTVRGGGRLSWSHAAATIVLFGDPYQMTPKRGSINGASGGGVGADDRSFSAQKSFGSIRRSLDNALHRRSGSSTGERAAAGRPLTPRAPSSSGSPLRPPDAGAAAGGRSVRGPSVPRFKRSVGHASMGNLPAAAAGGDGDAAAAAGAAESRLRRLSISSAVAHAPEQRVAAAADSTRARSALGLGQAHNAVSSPRSILQNAISSPSAGAGRRSLFASWRGSASGADTSPSHHAATAAAAAQQRERERQQALAAAPPKPPPMRILVAEDDRMSRALIKKILVKFGYEVTAVEDGEKAVAAFQAGEFHLVLTDLNMPICDGHEAARRIRALIATGQFKDTPIVALSASCSDAEVERCRESGMAAFLPKPLKMDAVGVLGSLIR